MPIYRLKPNDVLFFRDARPMSGSSSGHGARWPEPNVIFFAFHAAMHRAYPEVLPQEHLHRHGRSGKYEERRDKRFGSLQTAGPFPVFEETWFFPAPTDMLKDNPLVPLSRDTGISNLPKPLKYPLASLEKPSKDVLPTWWDKCAFEAYLNGKPTQGTKKHNSDFFHDEWATGIGIDPLTQTQDRVHIYSAQYMRLKDKASIGVFATMLIKETGEEGIRKLIARDNCIIVGGQQRVCRVQEVQGKTLDQIWPVGPIIPRDQKRIKWVLLSPAVFPRIGNHCGGWLPNWVDLETGRVLLHNGPGKNKAKRKKVPEGQPLEVRLVAARIPKPVHFSGWSERFHLKGEAGSQHGTRPTFLAVPAGAVYYFEGPDAPILADLLNWHGKERENVQGIVNRRSTLFGEQGFGLGVCGPWEFAE